MLLPSACFTPPMQADVPQAAVCRARQPILFLKKPVQEFIGSGK